MQDNTTFLGLIGRIYESALDAAVWPSVLGEVTDRVRGACADLTVINPLTAEFEIAAHHNWSDVLRSRVIANSYLNPVAHLGFTAPIDKPQCSSRDLDIVAFHNSQYWKKSFEGLGYYDYVTAVLSRSTFSFAAWGVLGTKERGAFGNEDIELFGLLSPHVGRAVKIARLLENRQLDQSLLHATLDVLAAAALLIEPGGKICYANPQGQNELAGQRLFREFKGKLASTTAKGSRFVNELNAIANDPRRHAQDTILAERSGEFLHTAVVPLPLETVKRGQFVLLLISQPDRDLESPLATAAARFRLSASETMVLGELLRGRTLVEIGDIQGVARSTVKTHLEAIFRKSGTKRQTELVAMTMGFVSHFARR